MQKNQALLDRFGATVKKLREERGLTQEQLAKHSGMTEKHVGEIERGITEASITALAGLARGLHVGVSALVADTHSLAPEPPGLSRAQWQAVYNTMLELHETARETLGFADNVKLQKPPSRPARNAPRKRKNVRR